MMHEQFARTNKHIWNTHAHTHTLFADPLLKPMCSVRETLTLSLMCPTFPLSSHIISIALRVKPLMRCHYTQSQAQTQ